MSKRVKSLITAELQNKFKGAESVVVVDYIGIDSKTTAGIRADLRKKAVKLTVVRNALAAKALETAGLKGAGSLLKGTNAVVYGGESVVDVVKELVEQAHDDAAYRYEAHLRLGYERWKRSRQEWEKSGKRPLLFVMCTDTEAANQIANLILGPPEA